jgi:hypothetical protein
MVWRAKPWWWSVLLAHSALLVMLAQGWMDDCPQMQQYGDPPQAIVDEIGAAIQSDLQQQEQGSSDERSAEGVRAAGAGSSQAGTPGAPPSFPQELLDGLPADLQRECCIQ